MWLGLVGLSKRVQRYSSGLVQRVWQGSEPDFLMKQKDQDYKKMRSEVCNSPINVALGAEQNIRPIFRISEGDSVYLLVRQVVCECNPYWPLQK
jgi:hypothetical protein